MGTSKQVAKVESDSRAVDSESHGGWWIVETLTQIKGEVALEFLPNFYAKAFSDGSIRLGDPHPDGEGPDPDEIFTATCAATNQIAFKSGYGRYLSIDSGKNIVGLSEAVGEKELFVPVFENDEAALSTFNHYFVSYDDDSDDYPLVARSQSVGTKEKMTLRVHYDPRKLDKQSELEEISEDNIFEAELSHLKKFHGSKRAGVDVNDDRLELKKARQDGHFYEALLEKRTKSKSDKYC